MAVIDIEGLVSIGETKDSRDTIRLMEDLGRKLAFDEGCRIAASLHCPVCHSVSHSLGGPGRAPTVGRRFGGGAIDDWRLPLRAPRHPSSLID